MPSIDFTNYGVKFNVKTADGLIDPTGTEEKTITVNGLQLQENSQAETAVQLFTNNNKGLGILDVPTGTQVTITAEGISSIGGN